MKWVIGNKTRNIKFCIKRTVTKVCLIIFMAFCFIIPVIAANNDTLSKIENSLYGFDYPHESKQNRVARLEKTIYGKSGSGDVNKRITKLSGDISADVIGLEIPAVKDTFLAEEEQKEEANVNYPVVNEIEQKLFNQTYKNRDFHTRIVTIEKKLFGKIYDVDDYPTRMDRIKAKVMPETLAKNNSYEDYSEEYDYNSIHSADLSGLSGSRYSMPFGQKNYTRPYVNYGNFASSHDAINSHDNLQNDLTQMEYDMFGTEFSNEDTHTRIKRLNSVNKAKKTSHKYDSQKFSQHMATAMEIGAMLLMILAMVL